MKKNSILYHLLVPTLILLPLMNQGHCEMEMTSPSTSTSHSGEMITPIENVFIPPVGYDDNDNIQIMVDGHLPSLCFELSETKVDIRKDSQTIQIKQFAHKKNIKDCQKNDLSNPNWPVSFQSEVSLGRLPVGKYKIDFQGVDGAIKSRTFEVSQGHSSSVDEKLYAPISSIFIPEMIYETEDGQVALTGILPSLCLNLESEKIQVQKLGDVIVVLPELTKDEQSHCEYSPRPLNVVASLGPLKSGRYLLHVRSMTGRSVSRVFTVLPKFENE